MMEYYSVTKRDKALTGAATWMDLRIIMLGGRRQTQGGTQCPTPFLCSDQHSKSMDTEGDNERLLKGFLWGMKCSGMRQW